MKLYTGIDKILYRYWRNRKPVLGKGQLVFLVFISSIPVYDVVNIGLRNIFKDLVRLKVEIEDSKNLGIKQVYL